jgi:hypothetical protein
MDMSKLPRMSQTPPPPPPLETDPPAAMPPGLQSPYPHERAYAAEPAPSFAEAWISIAIGAILLLFYFRPIEYLLTEKSKFAQKYVFSAGDGSPLTYTQTVFFWGDVAMLAFALVLILEGLLLFTRKPALIAAAFGFTVLVVALNVLYIGGMMKGGYGLQFPSALAAAFGVYIAIFQWKLLQSLRMSRSAGGR